MSLTPEEKRQALLAARLGGVQPTKRSAAPVEIVPIDRAQPAPLSAGQQGLVFDYHRHPGIALYNVTHSYVVVGDFDIDRFVGALETVVDAHEPLHTSCDSSRRRLPTNLALEVQRIDGDGRDFETLAQHRAETPIDIEQGPLVRALIATLGDQRHGIVLSMHHVSCDAGSLGAFWADLETVYGGDELPDRPVQYADHGEWQRSRVTNDDVAWWVDQLGDDAAPATLAFERPPADEPNGYVTQRLAVDPALLGDVGSRPFPVFLGAYAALLQHIGDTDDPVVGVAMSTRDHPATEAMVGYFLSILPLRIPVGDATFASLVADVDAIVASALAKRHVPFGRVAASRRAAGLSDDLLRTMFVFDEPVEPSLGGVGLSGRVHGNGASVAPVTLFVRRGSAGDGWEASLEYRGDVLTQRAARQLLAVFDTLLAALVSQPDTPVRDARHGSATHSELVGPEPTRSPTVVTELIEAAEPAGIAVTCGSASLTYGELHALADRFAVELRASGVKSGDRVALLLPRSIDLVVAIVAVLRAGAAYVPVDPTYPQERIRLITERCDPSAIVVATSTHPFDGDIDVLRVSTDVASLAESSALDPTWAPRLNDPAYVIFTSGSTGTPRGVEVSHRNLAASTLARFDVYDRQPDRFLLVSSYGFDSSIVGIFWTLCAGGTVVIPTDAEVHDFDKVADLIDMHEISHLLAVPTLYDALVRRSPNKLTSLRVAIVAGEAVPAALVSRHHAMVPTCQLMNEYGPTETTVWATSHDCIASNDAEAAIPIGTPIPGASTRVADRYGRPVPLGVAGELWIGGDGVTAGYLDDAEATARTFVTDPVSGRPMYRSGDRARIVELGGRPVLEFGGRLDNQLSVGGMRVEPEEIESVLTAHPSVQAAVVGAPVGHLAAVVESAVELDHQVLRDRCAALLPSALVPRSWVVVRSLTRTPHGKVDRAAAAPLLARVDSEKATPAGVPSDAVAAVLRVWQQVLGGRVGSVLSETSDFFAIGGDSLAALQLCEALEEEFGCRVGIGELIDSPTPLLLAGIVDKSVPAVVDTAPVVGEDLFEVLRRTGEHNTEAPVVLLAPGGGNLLAYQALVRGLPADQPVVGFRLPGANGTHAPVHTIVEQADRILPQLLANVAPDHPYRLVGWSTGGLLGIELAHRLIQRGHDVEFVAMVDTIYPGFQVTVQPTKLSKYAALHRSGGLAAVVEHGMSRAKIRARELSLQARTHLADYRGVSGGQRTIERRLFEIAFHAAATYRPAPFDGDVIFFAASGTDSSRTIGPWSSHCASLDVVVVEGEHAEENAVLDAARVSPIVDHLKKRLRGESR